ncbi:hypothetical protein GCM10009751_23290 [Myceligenerans crystallogenes]|uniref:Uncharacterized protein n=1 Tax=Myceligenerans crystallogenes TaxID=316335 RepID=A0ABN2NHG7_9MICO
MDVPNFDGPYANEFSEFYSNTSSDFAREVLHDGEISDAEYADMEKMFGDCLQDGGIEFSGFAPDGSYETSAAPNPDDTRGIVTGCEAKIGSDVIGALHDIIRVNPENIDAGQAATECLVERGVVADGYDVSDYERDLEGRFADAGSLPLELRGAFLECASNPFG